MRSKDFSTPFFGTFFCRYASKWGVHLFRAKLSIHWSRVPPPPYVQHSSTSSLPKWSRTQPSIKLWVTLSSQSVVPTKIDVDLYIFSTDWLYSNLLLQTVSTTIHRSWYSCLCSHRLMTVVCILIIHVDIVAYLVRQFFFQRRAVPHSSPNSIGVGSGEWIVSLTGTQKLTPVTWRLFNTSCPFPSLPILDVHTAKHPTLR